MKKAAVVLLLFAIGIGGAMLFRKPAQVGNLAQQRPALPPAPTKPELNVVQESIRPIVTSPVQGVPALPPKQHVDGPQSQPQRPAVLQPGARPPLPQLSEFGSTGSFAKKTQVPSSASPSRQVPATTPAPREPRRSSVPETPEQMHTIVNGDTLGRISRRYLGDASWADVIYRINSGLISDPNRLPLGEKIRIPSRNQLTQAAPQANASAADLVPLPQWSLKKTK